jgi:hypothetical protein
MAFRLALASKPLRVRLWLAGCGVGLLWLTFVAGNFVIDAQRAVSARMLGHDFLAFYTAGSFVRDGRADRLYDLRAVQAFERGVMQKENLEVGKSFGPFWNPPFYAWVFAPLAGLSS